MDIFSSKHFRKILDGKYVNEPAYALKAHAYSVPLIVKKRCTLLRHELCLQSEALYIVTS